MKHRGRNAGEERAPRRGCRLLTKPGYNLAATGKKGAQAGPSELCSRSSSPRAAAGSQRGGVPAQGSVCAAQRGVPTMPPSPRRPPAPTPRTAGSGWAGGVALWLLAKLCLHRARATAAARPGQMEPGAAMPRCGQAGLCPSLYEGAGTCRSLHCHPVGCRQPDTSPRCQNMSPSWQDGWVW